MEILRFLLIQQILVDQIAFMGWPCGTPSIPKILCESMERIRRSGSGFGGVDPRLAVHPERPSLTGLTGALHRSDRCKSLLGFGLGKCSGVLLSF
jgi:hypothetical protein